ARCWEISGTPPGNRRRLTAICWKISADAPNPTALQKRNSSRQGPTWLASHEGQRPRTASKEVTFPSVQARFENYGGRRKGAIPDAIAGTSSRPCAKSPRRRGRGNVGQRSTGRADAGGTDGALRKRAQ